MTDNEYAKFLLVGKCCDNCYWMSDYDPVCTFAGGMWLADEGVCSEWKEYRGMYRANRRSISETPVNR